MGIFQKSVLNKYLKNLDPAQVQTAFAKFQRFYGDAARLSNIERLKEESYQEGFLREIFVQVLGYTINPDPDYNLTTEFKNLTDSKKVDGAILRDGEALGVIELKSTRTFDLERIKQQAFSYKNNQPACKYVITSNFHFLRFYIDNATEYEEFDLFELTEIDFQKYYLLLARENLLADIPEKMKAETKFHEENISDRFYKDYSAFKRKIFENLTQNNPQYDKLTLFQKSQKLLDRLLFVFFAEDSGLVPPNAISRIIEQWNQLQELEAYQPLYDRFKLFFGHLNTGHKYQNYELSEYNGGLFAPDEILDNVKIDDPILHIEALKLSTYDFSTEIDVNILGHIFEHSLAEIEEISAELEGAPVDRKQSKRKKEGIFYTPKYITQYIVENTVGALCQEKKAELGIAEITIDESFRKKDGKISAKGKELFKTLETYKEWLLSLKILDPACGSGAFLNQALDFLIAEHRALDGLIQEITNESLGLFDTDKEILENNLYGVDLNEESVEIAKLSLWLRTARKGRQLSTLNENIKCGNSLIDDPAVAGTKAFNWQKEFPEIFAKGGFDVVIGNPPYVRAELLGYCREYLQRNYSVFNPSGDLFSYFYEKSFKLLKKKTGIFGFISNTFEKTTAGITLRCYLQNETKFQKYIDFTEVQIFEGATTYPVILIAKKHFDTLNIFEYIKIPKESQSDVIDIALNQSVPVAQAILCKENWTFKSNEAFNLVTKLSKHKIIKHIYGKCNRGIVTGFNDAFIIDSKIRDQIIKKSPRDREIIKYLLEGKDLEKWVTPEIDKFIIFAKRNINIDLFPEIKKHLEKYRLDLTPRFSKEETRGRKPGNYKWFEIQDSVDYYLNFEKSKIVFPNLQNSNKFAFDETGAYINAPAVILPISDKFLTAILNSKIVWFFLTNICVVRNGGYIEVKPQYFEQIPIPDIPNSLKTELSVMTEKIISDTHKAQSIKTTFIKLVSSKFSEIKITKKLDNWFDISFADFSKEIKNQRIKLTIAQESEWIDYFESQSKAYRDLIQSIVNQEKEIDKMVYKLYDLTPEEIKIVEESVR